MWMEKEKARRRMKKKWEKDEQGACRIGSSDFDIFLEIQYASCGFGLALKS